jgi:uncharacterized integral membrane protein
VRNVLWIGVVIAVAAYAIYVAISNGDRVSFDLLFFRAEGVPLWLLVLGAFVLGAALTGAVATLALVQLRFRLRGQRREIGRLEQEVHGLRTLPLEPEDAGARAREG